MRSVETSAKTRKEAIQKALEELGAEMHEVEITIVDEGSKGLFGIGARDVRIRVTKEGEEEPAPRRERKGPRGDRGGDRKPREQRGGDRGKPRGDRPERSGARQSADAPSASRGTGDARSGNRETTERRGEGRGGRNKRRPERSGARGEGGNRPERQERNEGQGAEGERSERRDKRGEGRGRRGGRGEVRGEGRGDQPKREQPAAAAEAQPERAERQERPEREPRPARPRKRDVERNIDPEKAEQTGNAAAALLEEVITKMGMQSKVTSKLNENNDIVLTIDSEDSAILIGRKGRNLSAMQFLINRMVLDPEDEGGADRIVVDVEGYLDRRQSSLEELAQRMAERAKETGRSVRINKPLSPQERRIIHLALEGDEDVDTYSLGSAIHRRVVIVPKGGDVNDVEDSEPSRERRPPRGRSNGGDRAGRGYRGGDEDDDNRGNRADQPQPGEQPRRPDARGPARPKRGAKGPRMPIPYKVDVASVREQSGRDQDE